RHEHHDHGDRCHEQHDVVDLRVAIAPCRVEAHRLPPRRHDGAPPSRRAVGSSSGRLSSSMLTSRKVSPRTEGTKRAGRHMSHTHASRRTNAKYTSAYL